MEGAIKRTIICNLKRQKRHCWSQKRKSSKARLQKRLTKRIMRKGNDGAEADNDANDQNLSCESEVKHWSAKKSTKQLEKEKVITKLSHNQNAYFDFLCPIGLKVMKHPYFCKSDGYTYEKKKLLRHLKKNGLVSPMTGEVISKDFIHNHALEQAILYWQSHSNNYVPGLKGKKGGGRGTKVLPKK